MAVNVTAAPSQTEELLAVKVANGRLFTLTVTSSVVTQPSLVVPVTVYVVVELGLAVTVVPVVVFNPIDGLQTYDKFGFAVADNIVFSPEQIVTSAPASTAGAGFMVMVSESVTD